MTGGGIAYDNLIHRIPDDFRDRADLETRSRAAIEIHPVDANLLRCRMLAGPEIFVDPSDMSLAPWFETDGFWEAWITLAFLATVRPGWACVDVGANIGYYTLLMADRAGPAGRVLAVEPNPRMADLIRRSAALNGYATVEIAECAATHASGAARLWIKREAAGKVNLGGATLHPRWDVGPWDQNMTIRTEPLDALLADWPALDFIKIDAEGAEVNVWRGMRGILARHFDMLVVMEAVPGRGYDLAELLALVREDGFPIRILDTDGDIKMMSDAELLARHPDEWMMLWLQR